MNSNSSTMLPKNIDLANLRIGDVKVSENAIGSKSAYLNYGGGGPLFIQTPKLKVAFTMSKYGGGNDKDKKVESVHDVAEKLSLVVSMEGAETNKSVGHFYKLLKGIDHMMIEAGVENSKAWFKGQKDKEVIEQFYSSSLCFSKDKMTGEINDKYAPTFRMGVQVMNGRIKTDCYNENNELIEGGIPFPIEKGTDVTAIVQCSSIWFVGANKFGVMLRPIALKVVASSTHFNAFAFPDDGEDEATGSVTKATSAMAKTSFIESSDDEDGDIPVAPKATKDESDDEDEEVPTKTK